MLNLDRKQAKKLGLIRYYTGKPCKHGHIAERLTVKKGSSVNSLGVPIYVATTIIESKWYRPDMSWQTWGAGPGKWQVDHIKPLSSFDLTDPQQLAEACHISNLQLLWWDDHVKKTTHQRDLHAKFLR